ncbi:Translation initiation factor [Trichinella spiralis]|uniref:Translation initiation factor n=1 Tax=Trichinella spiralis TaxID=6334 RepID=A0ABR3K9Y9_TRISP
MCNRYPIKTAGSDEGSNKRRSCVWLVILVSSLCVYASSGDVSGTPPELAGRSVPVSALHMRGSPKTGLPAFHSTTCWRQPALFTSSTEPIPRVKANEWQVNRSTHLQTESNKLGASSFSSSCVLSNDVGSPFGQ